MNPPNKRNFNFNQGVLYHLYECNGSGLNVWVVKFREDNLVNDTQKDKHIHTQTQETTTAEGQTLLRMKIKSIDYSWSLSYGFRFNFGRNNMVNDSSGKWNGIFIISRKFLITVAVFVTDVA